MDFNNFTLAEGAQKDGGKAPRLKDPYKAYFSKFEEGCDRKFCCGFGLWLQEPVKHRVGKVCLNKEKHISPKRPKLTAESPGDK